MSANELFTNAFNAISATTEYDPVWANNTGYFDYAVKLELSSTAMCKSVDPHGRRIIMVGTVFGTVVVFDRYSDQEGKEDAVFVANTPQSRLIGALVPEGKISRTTMGNIVGWHKADRNLGNTIETIVAEVKQL